MTQPAALSEDIYLVRGHVFQREWTPVGGTSGRRNSGLLCRRCGLHIQEPHWYRNRETGEDHCGEVPRDLSCDELVCQNVHDS
jgi:hypothetical protein